MDHTVSGPGGPYEEAPMGLHARLEEVSHYLPWRLDCMQLRLKKKLHAVDKEECVVGKTADSSIPSTITGSLSPPMHHSPPNYPSSSSSCGRMHRAPSIPAA